MSLGDDLVRFGKYTIVITMLLTILFISGFASLIPLPEAHGFSQSLFDIAYFIASYFLLEPLFNHMLFYELFNDKEHFKKARMVLQLIGAYIL